MINCINKKIKNKNVSKKETRKKKTRPCQTGNDKQTACGMRDGLTFVYMKLPYIARQFPRR